MRISLLSVCLALASLTSCRTASNENRSDVKIVGGEVVAADNIINKVTVSVLMTLTDGRKAACSGVLIGSNIVLTAAHCKPAVGDQIGFGTSKNPGPERVRIISAVMQHPCYGQNVSEFDLAMVRFDGDVPTGFGPPVSLVSAEKSLPAGSPVTIAGYGLSSPAGVGSPDGILRKVDLNVLFDKTYSPRVFVLRSTAVKSACFGDSGGPMFVLEEQLVAAGIANTVLGDLCDDLSLYTDLRAHRDWIKSAAAALMAHAMPESVPSESVCPFSANGAALPQPIDDFIRGPRLCRIARDADPSKIYASGKTTIAGVQGGVAPAGNDLPNEMMFSVPKKFARLDVCKGGTGIQVCPSSDSGNAITLSPVATQNDRSCFQFINSTSPEGEYDFVVQAHTEAGEPSEIVAFRLRGKVSP